MPHRTPVNARNLPTVSSTGGGALAVVAGCGIATPCKISVGALLLLCLLSEPLSPEELERGNQLARRYTQQMMKRHKIQEKDLQQKIRNKWRAIHALPSLELRKEVCHRASPLGFRCHSRPRVTHGWLCVTVTRKRSFASMPAALVAECPGLR